MATTRAPRTDLLCRPALQEVGKLKLGTKDFKNPRRTGTGQTWFPPLKLDHWLVTTCERDEKGELIPDFRVMEKVGKEARDLEVVLPYDDLHLNFFTRFAARKGSKYACRSDQDVTSPGTARRAVHMKDWVAPFSTPCPCAWLEKGWCKPFGILRVLLTASPTLGGFYVFRTGSWNTIRNILSSLAMFSTLTHGRLSGLKLILRASPQTVEAPAKGGGTRKVTIYAANLVYPGDTERFLADTRDTFRRREELDASMRSLLAAPADLGIEAAELAAVDEYEAPEDPDAVLEDAREFQPDQQDGAPAAAHGVTLARGAGDTIYVLGPGGVELGAFNSFPDETYRPEVEGSKVFIVNAETGVRLVPEFSLAGRPKYDDDGPEGDDIPF